jgi:hypothetical protein
MLIKFKADLHSILFLLLLIFHRTSRYAVHVEFRFKTATVLWPAAAAAAALRQQVITVHSYDVCSESISIPITIAAPKVFICSALVVTFTSLAQIDKPLWPNDIQSLIRCLDLYNSALRHIKSTVTSRQNNIRIIILNFIPYIFVLYVQYTNNCTMLIMY